MGKKIGWVIPILLSFTSLAQRERVHLDLSRYSFKAGDTIYLKGTIFKGDHLSPASKNLYTELYTENGVLLSRYVFPIFHGQSLGRIILPDSLATANYYILALTRQQLNYDSLDFFSVPILVYNKDKPATDLYHKQQVLPTASVAVGTIKGISWLTTIYKDNLSSKLEVDSSSGPRHLQIIDPLTNDSALGKTVQLDSNHLQQYCLFPLQPERDSEVLFLLEDSVLIGRQVIRIKNSPQPVQLVTDTLDTSPYGYNSWSLNLPDTNLWYATISISDADRSLPSPEPITRLNGSYTDDFTKKDSLNDDAYISLSGNATRLSGKKIKDPFVRQMIIAGTRDSNYLFTKVVDLDPDGNFKIDSLFFYGSIGLQFQINGAEGSEAKNVRLRLAGFTPPPVDSSLFVRNWEDDKLPIGAADTTYTPIEFERYVVAKMQTLKAAVVKGWKNPRLELDETYTSGPFAEPAIYSYDLRTDSTHWDLFTYLNDQNIRLYYDLRGDTMADRMGHRIHYFLDQQEYTPLYMHYLDFERLAYVKILESDFLSTQKTEFTMTYVTKRAPGQSNLAGPPVPRSPLGKPEQLTALNVCIYTRKGNDFRTMRGSGMNGLTIKGYNDVFPQKTDYVTLYWHPMESGHSFHIAFNNSVATKRFRVNIDGVNAAGKLIHYEKVISGAEGLTNRK